MDIQHLKTDRFDFLASQLMQADVDPFLSIYRHLMLPLLHGFIYKYLQRFYGALFLAVSKAGVMIPPLCVNLQILRTLELPVCLFVPV